MDWRESAAELERARAERPVIIPGPEGELSRMFTPAAPDAAPAGMCVMQPIRCRWKRGRYGVETSRKLAVLGFDCLRFEYHDHGEGSGATVVSELDGNHPHTGDMLAAIRFAREKLGQHRFILSGMCFDARTAISVFPEEGDSIEGIALTSPTVLRELDSFMTLRHVFSALKSPHRVKKFIKAKTPWGARAAALAGAMRRSMPGEQQQSRAHLDENFVTHLRALARSRARALFLYGSADLYYYEGFKLLQSQMMSRFDAETLSRFDIEIWDGRVHVFDEAGPQRRVLEKTIAWIGSFHPQARTTKASEPESRPRKETAWTSA